MNSTANRSNEPHLPACFGVLETVFPHGPEGLRQTPETCLACAVKTECLRRALKGANLYRLQDEKVDRAYASGRMGFLERWARKKALRRKTGPQR